jgi:hypothetical protein
MEILNYIFGNEKIRFFYPFLRKFIVVLTAFDNDISVDVSLSFFFVEYGEVRQSYA